MILTIDQSFSKSGWVLFSKEKKIKNFGVIKTTTKQGNEAARIYIIKELFRELIKNFNVKVLVIENLPFGAHSRSVRMLSGLYFSLEILCIEEEIEFFSYFPTSVKKKAGFGGNKKVDMIEALPDKIKNVFSEKFNKNNGLEDLADAYFLGICYFSKK